MPPAVDETAPPAAMASMIAARRAAAKIIAPLIGVDGLETGPCVCREDVVDALAKSRTREVEDLVCSEGRPPSAIESRNTLIARTRVSMFFQSSCLPPRHTCACRLKFIVPGDHQEDGDDLEDPAVVVHRVHGLWAEAASVIGRDRDPERLETCSVRRHPQPEIHAERGRSSPAPRRRQ